MASTSTSPQTSSRAYLCPSRNKRNAGEGYITNLGESPLTRKQKQLQEFTISLKQGAINKYGKQLNEIGGSPVVTKQLKLNFDRDAGGLDESNLFTNDSSFLDQKEENQSYSISNNYKKRATKKNSTDCYIPSFYENAKDTERRPVSISQNKIEVNFLKKKVDGIDAGYYSKMSKANYK